ncbi:hypothetical protein M5K25_004913 [Dendrobium thyrsiflorum]|uniref:BHLH domain-containing protein n=1 Tax=Dendrobium thyrsiflorum TaxID=117978 RepID=A0ABD0VHI1_DENTH
MEVFSNDQSQLSFMDSVYLPDSPSYTPFNIHGKPKDLSNEFCFPSYDHRQESSLTETFSSSKEKSEESQRKKRTRNNVNCLTTAHSKSKNKRTKKSNFEKMEMEEKKKLPAEYIHVRARRGQATDSHSLAERARRERISKRMKILQDLIPGCEKVTGKALVLDKIINYVESLKNQVEFLSMRLASVNLVLYEFGLNFDDFTSTKENLDSNPQLLSSMVHSSHIQSTEDDITVMVSSSSSALYGQRPAQFPQASESFYMQMGGQTEALDHQVDPYSMFSFQQN